MARFTLVKDHPMVEDSWSSLRKYPFNTMQRDHSFFVPVSEVKDQGKLNVVQSILLGCAYSHKNRCREHKVFTSRRVQEDGTWGIRVWRIV